MPSPAARKYALNLAAERDIPPVTPQTPPGVKKAITDLRRLQSAHGHMVSAGDCSRVIDWLKDSVPRKGPSASAAPPPGAVPPRWAPPQVRPGCFWLNDRIWIVQERVTGTGVYALLLTERPAGGDTDRVDFTVDYDRPASDRVLAVLTEDHRMSFAQARPYMQRYKRCIAPAGRRMCGLRLTAEESVAVAIGTVCGPKFPGYHEAVEEYRASKKHDLYEAARDELGLVCSDVELYRLVGGQVATVKGIERKLDSIPA
jgi:hypothetical protein